MKNSGISLLILGTISLFACNTNNTAETAQLLVGRWELVQALRNGSPTESLAELYFEFTADGKLMTNITGVPEEGTYELKKEQLLQRNTQIDADYTIEEIADSSLTLTTNLRGYSFQFDLKKSGAGGADTTQQGDMQ
ncbi:MAG: hypothetical protein ACK4TA_18635 [Saprospiraceae bacterium]